MAVVNNTGQARKIDPRIECGGETYEGWWEGPQSGPVDLIDGAEGVLHLLEANAHRRGPKRESRFVGRDKTGNRLVVKRLVHDDRHDEPTRYSGLIVTLLSDPPRDPRPTYHLRASGLGLRDDDENDGSTPMLLAPHK